MTDTQPPGQTPGAQASRTQTPETQTPGAQASRTQTTGTREQASVDDIVRRVRLADRQALAKVITLIESTRQDHRRRAQDILLGLLQERSNHADTLRIGITGPPGAGKSTLIETLGMYVVEQGKKVGVLAVDPSSKRSKGSILGDKTRMEHLAQSEQAFVRPSPSGLTLGGIARHTYETILCCESAGYDVIFVETVGVGQSETAVHDVTDMFVLVLPPAAGDGLQGIKRGILEVADMIVVNKADGDLRAAAGRAAAEYAQAMTVMPRGREGWDVPVEKISAIEGRGMDALWQSMESFQQQRRKDGSLLRQRAEQSVSALWAEVHERVASQIGRRGKAPSLEKKVAEMKMLPALAAAMIAEEYFAFKKKEP